MSTKKNIPHSNSLKSGTASVLNSTTTALGSSATFTGIWEDVVNYASITVVANSDQTMTLYADFSIDGITTDRAIQLSDGLNGSAGIHSLTPVANFFRVRVVNSTVAQTSLRVKTLFHVAGKISFPTARISQTLNTYTDVLNTRSVLFGANKNGRTFSNVNVSENNRLEIDVCEPLSSFGELLTVNTIPQVQISGLYGLLGSDVETFTGTNGSVSATSGLMQCMTGTSIGGYGVIRSKRFVQYRPGQGIKYRFSSMYTTGVANSMQMSGAFSAIDGLWFGYYGTSFGIMRRVPGACTIQRLTVSAGTGGSPETVTINLNSVAFTVSVIANQSTTTTAELLSERVGGYTGWTSTVSPTANGATVTFIQATPGAANGTYTMSSTGSAAGTFALIQQGVANDDVTGFVAKTSWNYDTMDGSLLSTNPSGITLDPTKLNVYQISFAYLGAASITFSVMDDTGHFIVVHRIRYPNSYTTPNARNPTMRVGWFAYSLGSTTNLTVSGASASGFTEGQTMTMRDPFSVTSEVTSTTTEYAALLIRSRGEFANTNNQRLVLPISLSIALETSNRVVRVKCYLNPTVSGTTNYTYIDQTLSGVEYCAAPTTTTVSGGRQVSAGVVASGSALNLRIGELDLRMEAGDLLVITVQAASSTSLTNLALNWQEI